MNFKDILDIPKGKLDVFIGYDNDNNNLSINLEKNPNILITGSTGTSKSIVLNQILKQLTNSNNENELKIICISKTKVELQEYEKSNYNYFINKDTVNLNDILKAVDNRITEINSGANINELPYLVIAIDEANDIISDPEKAIVLKSILDNCKNIKVSLIMNTNNVYNYFFDNNYNLDFSCRISFDYVSKEDTTQNNIEKSNNLLTNEFLIEINQEKRPHKYYSYFSQE